MAPGTRPWNRVVRSRLDTVSNTLPSPGRALSGASGPERTARRRPVLTALTVLLCMAALAMTFVRLPYFTFMPGSVNPLSERVVVLRGERFPATGEVYFTTVRQDSSVNGWEYLRTLVDGSVLLVGEDAVLGDRSRDENREFNMQLMRVSKSTAEAVALRHLGLDPYRATGVGMSSVREPAADHLTTGDVIVAVDGVSTMKAEDLIEAIHSRYPGDVVVIDIEAVDGSDPRTVSVTLGTREDDPTIGFLGIGPQTRWEDVEDLPVDVGVRTDQVGGNSAGLALTLAILDLLTPGELTGGLQVAGTGTIDLEGQVGPIGGIRQKVIAARRAGMDVLLVPRNELPEALDVAGDLQVEGVATLDEALMALAGLGGNADSLALPAGS